MKLRKAQMIVLEIENKEKGKNEYTLTSKETDYEENE